MLVGTKGLRVVLPFSPASFIPSMNPAQTVCVSIKSPGWMDQSRALKWSSQILSSTKGSKTSFAISGNFDFSSRPEVGKGTVLPYRVPQAKRAVLPYRKPQAKLLPQKYRGFLIPRIFSQVIPQYRYFRKMIPNTFTDTVKNPKYRGICGIPRFSNTANFLIIAKLKMNFLSLVNY